MRKVFHTRQFMAGNSPAVRIPVSMAFPKQTKLVVIREGNRLIGAGLIIENWVD
ncbi:MULTISPECIES: hypothetical protein [Acidithiobacillus]|uniref:AbrB family transcriptional regulator n=1 Tax=Acidithiobacillus thiooxidans ATCC 19377 TaxID=637390 RepID=A0A5P9XNT4_ACITH|nr:MULTISPECIES: hypothetical protein [Acidithiobacillus]QFX95304.1 AbrB family transcriptional regulator [Acidithiobacillus thiooxidans ATCC 19377]